MIWYWLWRTTVRLSSWLRWGPGAWFARKAQPYTFRRWPVLTPEEVKAYDAREAMRAESQAIP